MLYLFRDPSSNTFAFSLDVTGRNIPQHTERTKWMFVTVTSEHDVLEGEEAKRSLQGYGFYLFEKGSSH